MKDDMNKKRRRRNGNRKKNGPTGNERPGGPNPQRGDPDQYPDRREFDRRADNDVDWYTKYPQLVKPAGEFSFPYRPGMNIDILTLKNGGTFTYKIPGVLALQWIPSMGISNTGDDPATIVASEMYARVRETFSGSLAADGPDIFMYMGALDSVFLYIAYLKRIYRLLTAWSPDNYVLPDRVLQAVGVTNPAALRKQKRDLNQYINELILQSRKFRCPAVMDLMNRHYWMSDNVYTDDETINSQFYLFTPMAVYQYAELNNTSGDPASGLQMVAIPKGNVTAEQYYEFGLSLLNALVKWDTAYDINGYLKGAFKGVPEFVVDDLPENQPFSPVYSEEVLVQIENSMAVPAGCNNDFTLMNVTQNTLENFVISNPTLDFSVGDLAPYTMAQWLTNFWSFSPTLSQRSDEPSVAMNIIATRLKSHVKSISQVTESGTTKVRAVIEAGTEIALGWYIYEDDIGVYPYDTCQYISSGNPAFPDVAPFDWHPIGWRFVSSGNVNKAVCVGDIHNLTTIGKDKLANLHRICIFSEFSAFSIA